MSEEYTAADIVVLDGTEAVRLRPGMYVGSTGVAGARRMLLSLLDALPSEGRVEIHQSPDGAWTVMDEGPGIPVDEVPTAIEERLCVLHGLFFALLPCVNALSVLTTVVVDRGGERFVQAFSRGRRLGPCVNAGRSSRTGTTVRFLPDPQIFGELPVDLGLDAVLHERAYLQPGLQIVWNGRVVHQPEGLAAYVREHAQGPVGRVARLRQRVGDAQVEVAWAPGAQRSCTVWGQHVAQEPGSRLAAVVDEAWSGEGTVAVSVTVAEPQLDGVRGRLVNPEAVHAVRQVLGALEVADVP